MAKKILIIEDDQDVIDLVRMALVSKGYDVDHAYDGRQGIQKIKERKPDLLITDLTMPVMDGWAVLIALKKNPEYAAMPVIIITSSQEMQHVEKARRIGVESFVIKPFEPQKIVRIARHLLDPDATEDNEGFSGLMEGDLLSRGGL